MNRYKLTLIPANSSKGLIFKHGDIEIKILAVHQDGEIYCYHNVCPHTGVNLDWSPDQFLDVSGKLIQCATHGALFRIEDGYCISGPCSGAYLKPLKASIDGEFFDIILD